MSKNLNKTAEKVTLGLFRLSSDRARRFLWSSSGIIILILGWEYGALNGYLPARYTSMPSSIVNTAWRMWASGTLFNDVVTTMKELSIGLSLAIVLAVPLGLLAGWYRRLQYAVEPYLAALYATPSLALLPLLVLWFGIGIPSTTALVVISSFFPIAINVLYGVKTVDITIIKMARSFNARQSRIFYSVILPACVPFLASGLQLGVARGLIGVIVGEMYAATDGGLGYIISVAGSTGAVDQMFVAVTVITALGIALMTATDILERHFQRWKVSAL